MIDQKNKFQVMFQLTLQNFYFSQQSEKILQAFQKKELFLAFFLVVDGIITDAKLIFEAPTQQGIMIDDTVILVCVCVCVWYMLLLREIFW